MSSMLYIDFTHSLPSKLVASHGGGNYTKTLLLDLENYICKQNYAVNIILLWPKDYKAKSEIENRILKSKIFSVEYIDITLEKFKFEEGATVFIPLLGVKEFPLLKKIKEKNNIELIITVHGLRLLDMCWDKYDLSYHGNKADKIKCVIKDKYLLSIRQMFYKKFVKNYLKFCDKVITVSNYSLSSISKYANLKRVYLQYENILQVESSHREQIQEEAQKYILFVSGNRPEKNLARSIVAYKKYAERNKNALPLYIVGTNETVQKNLSNALQLRHEVIEKKIVFFKYVSDEELATLYANATFLLYTSKSEGFGLPALEAAKHGCPVVAAYGTSIPEVLGGNALYVNPYSVESIVSGIENMGKDNMQKFYRYTITNSIPAIEKRIADSNEGLFRYLLE